MPPHVLWWPQQTEPIEHKPQCPLSCFALSPSLPQETETQSRAVMAVRQGRGSAATQGLSLGLLLMCLLFLGAGAATYDVDWSFAADSWSRGKNFRAGDVLVFSYNPSAHNLVVVDAGGYNGCRGSGAAYSSGNDRVTLGAGTNYFICSLNGHCGMGMKMAVTAN